MANIIIQKFSSILDLLLPPRCAICTQVVSTKSNELLCLECLAHLPLAKKEVPEFNQTKIFLNQLFSFSDLHCLLEFQKGNSTEKLLYQLKYGNRESIGSYLGELCATGLKDELAPYQLIITVPIHPKKLKKRGYNQVHGFANAIGKGLSIEVKHELLKRVKHTKSQTKRKFHERYKGLENTFVLSEKIPSGVKKILLLDDVITTGSTLAHCAKALNCEANVKVSALTIAYRR